MPTVPEGFWRATVLRTEQLSPVTRRVLLGGDGLAGWVSSGAPDEWLRLMVPPGRQRAAPLPTRLGQSWMFPNPQPAPRWYSVRRWDPERTELVVDVVIHREGLATRWAETVAPGDEIVVSQPHGRLHDLTADWLLVAADQTGIPAASRILAELPAGTPVFAIFEAPDEEATFSLRTAAELRISWVFNPAPETSASPLSAAVRSLDLPSGEGFVWMASEAACARDVRRYFRHELKWRSARYDIVGYWRPDAEAYAKRYAEVSDHVGRIYDHGVAAGRDSEAILDDVFGVLEPRGL